MSNIQSVVNSLLARSAKLDPVLLSILQEMLNEIDRLGIIIDPPPITATKISSADSNIPENVTSFTSRFTTRNVILEWTPANNDSVFYEVRSGTDWNTADRLFVTAERQAILDPLLEGTYTYLIKVLSFDGIYSIDTESVEVTVTPIGSTVISSSTIDQNVLLYWTEPDSIFEIAEYIITKDGSEIGRVSATFKAIVELVGNTYEYGISAVDIAGNVGPETVVTVDVDGPPDFVLQAEFDSAFSGTKTNALVVRDTLLLPVKLTETWRQHFVNNGWTTPRDQINAGFPFYAQPTLSTASYKEVFDIGVIYTNTIISTSYNLTVLDGQFNIGVSTRVSDDGISWSAPQTGLNIFVTSVRYIETTVNFTGLDNTSLLSFFNFHLAVSIKETVDSGDVSALSTDANGTVITFNKAFKDVNSITVSVKTDTREQFIAIYKFTDIPNPVNFSVFAYDSSGIRVSKTVSWKARGVV